MYNVPNIAQSLSVKTRYVPIVRAIYDHIREQHVAQSKTPSARPLFSQAPGFPPPSTQRNTDLLFRRSIRRELLSRPIHSVLN